MALLTDIPGHIVWRCRRGMLELDVLFEQFLEQYYWQLSELELVIWQDFLAENDQDIQAWLFGDKATLIPEQYIFVLDLLLTSHQS